MKNLSDYYSASPSTRSLASFKESALEIPTQVKVMTKITEKNENWMGYSSSSSPERIDSDSDNQEDSQDYIEALAKGIEIDENIRKVQMKKFEASKDVNWLGVKPEQREKLLQVPDENLKTIYRDKNGVVVDKRKKEKISENEERLAKWATGEVQLQAKRKLEEEIEREKGKPFARYQIDENFDSELKKKNRFGDPLAEFRTGPDKKRKLNWENRFGIVPGKMWDGVDRTNGFEQRWLAKQGRKEWENSMAHKEFASEL